MKWRVIAALVSLTAIVLIVQDIPLAAYLRSVESSGIITELQRDAFVIAGRSEQVLDANDRTKTPALNAMLNEYARTNGANVVVVNSQGDTVAASGATYDPIAGIADRPEIQVALNGDTATGEREVMGRELLYVAVPVLSGARTLGAVRITYPSSILDQRVNNRLLGITLVAGLTLLVAIGVAFLLASTITRRIIRLQTTTAQLARGDLTARAETTKGAPELRQLGTDLNSMASQLSTLLEAQRSFASDASHQLRTPLTALRLRLDQAAEELMTSPADAAETLDEARAETERLQHLIDGLLRLARAEGRPGECIDVDLAMLVRERIWLWTPLAEEQSVLVKYTGPAHCFIQAVDSAPEQILDNYLDNALSISPAGSAVTVAIVRSGEHVTLTVSDEGPGLTPEQRRRAFDRFWSMRKDNAGTGLGLAIVRQLADASGATVELRQSATGGVSAVAIFQTRAAR